MPTRGYRKGISDSKTAAPRRIYTRLPAAIHDALVVDSTSRNRPASEIIRAVLVAHYSGTRLELPQARGPSSAAIRELARIGNNLNQLAHQANLVRLPLIQAQASAALKAVLDAVARL